MTQWSNTEIHKADFSLRDVIMIIPPVCMLQDLAAGDIEGLGFIPYISRGKLM